MVLLVVRYFFSPEISINLHVKIHPSNWGGRAMPCCSVIPIQLPCDQVGSNIFICIAC